MPLAVMLTAGAFGASTLLLAAWVLLGDGIRFDDSSSSWSALWIGDVDADGVPDLALGIGAEPSALRGDGRARILSGATGATLSELRGLNLHNRLSHVVGPVRDLLGPGRPGLWWEAGNDELHVSTDGLGSTSTRFEVDLGGPPSELGDVDGDGAPDLLVSGFPRRQGHDTISAVSLSSGEAIWTLSEPEHRSVEDDPFGWTACAVGDIDGDGVADAAIVDHRARVLLVSGRNGTLLRELEQHVRRSGGLLAPLGDVDGDGLPELCVYAGWTVVDDFADPKKQIPLHVVRCVDGTVLQSFAPGKVLVEAWSPGDLDGDARKELAWRGSDGFGVARISDGARLDIPESRAMRAGSADYDGDGHCDSLVAHNVLVKVHEELPKDLWRRGRIEVVSGRDGSLLRTFDESVLPPRED